MTDDEYQIMRKYVNRNFMQELRWVSHYPPSGMSNQDKDFIRWLAMTAYDRINELEHQWIPVAERLPKLGEMVAVYMHSAIHGDEVKIDRMVISNTTDIPYWSFYKGRVKAWMPLPEPPKEETDG